MHIFAMLIEKLKKHLLRLAAGENNAFYINGTDVLPTPLSQAQEAAYLKRLENGDAEARKVLIEKNLRLVVFIAKKFDSVTCGIEDLISIGTIGLIKAINTFRTDKNIKLATYASRCIENEILMYLRKTSGKGQVLSIDEPLNVDWEGNELLLCDVLSQDGDTVYHRLETNEDHKPSIAPSAISARGKRQLLNCVSALIARKKKHKRKLRIYSESRNPIFRGLKRRSFRICAMSSAVIFNCRLPRGHA